jgi:hypothetical protein
VFGVEFRVVDVTRDEVPDHRRHSVYHGRVISTVLDLGRKEGRTLSIEKGGVVLEV